MQTSLAICFSEGVNNTGYLICQKNYRQKLCHRPESQACPEICLLAKLIYRFIDWKNYIIPCINLVKNMCNEKRYTKLTSQRQSPFIQAMYKQLKKSCLVKWDFLWISYKEPLSYVHWHFYGLHQYWFQAPFTRERTRFLHENIPESFQAPRGEDCLPIQRIKLW